MAPTSKPIIVLTRVPADSIFDAPATAAAAAGSLVFRDGGQGDAPRRLLPGQSTTAERTLLAAECWLDGDVSALIDGLQKQGTEVWVEITDAAQAEMAVAAGAAGLVLLFTLLVRNTCQVRCFHLSHSTEAAA